MYRIDQLFSEPAADPAWNIFYASSFLDLTHARYVNKICSLFAFEFLNSDGKYYIENIFLFFYL